MAESNVLCACGTSGIFAPDKSTPDTSMSDTSIWISPGGKVFSLIKWLLRAGQLSSPLTIV